MQSSEFMIGCRCFSRRWLWVVVAIGFGATRPAAFAQAEVDAPDEPAAGQAQVTMTREQFVQWIDQVALGSENGIPGARAALETILNLKIEHLERTCGLSEIQQRKLHLAGRGDIKRFFDLVADHRRKYDKIKDSQEELGKLQAEIQELANRRGKPMFEEGSIFCKALSRMLTADQTAKIEVALRQSRRFRHRAKIDLVVQSLDVVAGLSDEQREQLTQLLLRETRPARNSFVDLDVEIVIAQSAALPEAKIRAIFDQDQWRSVAPVLRALKQNFQETLNGVELAGDDEPSGRSSALTETRLELPVPEKSKAK